MFKNLVELYKNNKIFRVLAILCPISIYVLIAGLVILAYCDVSLFSDFAETLTYALIDNPYIKTGPYEIHTVYPPFAFLPFLPFALICKEPILDYIEGTKWISDIIVDPSYLFSYFLFFVITTSILLFVIAKISKFKGWKLIILLVSVVTFAPFVYIFIRANNIVFALMFCAIFFWLHDSKVRWHREVANVCLACAIAIKLFPALILLYFLKDRRWLDIVKTIIYALALLILPFVFIEGTFSNIPVLFNTFSSFSSEFERVLCITNISLDSFAGKVSHILGLLFHVDLVSTLYPLLSKILRFGTVILTAITLILAKNHKNKFQPILLSILTYNLFQGISYSYVFAFLIIPITFYLTELDTLSKFDQVFYGVSFLIMSIDVLAIFHFFVPHQIIAIVLVFKSACDMIREYLKQKNAVSVTETNDSIDDSSNPESIPTA